MEPLTIEESYQTILHDLDRLTENVLLLREACVQSKKISMDSMEDVLAFLQNNMNTTMVLPAVTSNIRGREAAMVIMDDLVDLNAVPAPTGDQATVEDAFAGIGIRKPQRGYTKKTVTLAGIEHIRSFPRDIFTLAGIKRILSHDRSIFADTAIARLTEP